MRTQEHAQHIATRISNSNCPECRADTERRFVNVQPWKYQHVHEYLSYVKPCLQALRDGADTADARIWARKFRKALHTRITERAPRIGRKYCDSYLERLGQFKRNTDARYLQRFASRGASCLD